MFTGIVQGLAQVAAITDRPGLRSFELALPAGFDTGLEIGASVACDGVCLTVTTLPAPGRATFDVMQQSLGLTTLGSLVQGVGASWQMAELTTSEGMVALVQASTTLPIMVLAVAAGAVADNFDRRRVMLWAQCFMAGVSALLALGFGLAILGYAAVYARLTQFRWCFSAWTLRPLPALPQPEALP